MDSYSIILADPPWSYKDKCNSGQRGVEFKYPTMTIEDINNLPINKVAADDCALFLWATAPLMQEALCVMNSWGFEYKTVAFTWIKRNKVADSLFWGMGNWTRSNPEFCLLGLKGKPRRISASVHSVIYSPIQGHSVKPAETRDRIVNLLGDIPRVELFARQPIDGWTSIGNDIDGRDIREVLSDGMVN